MMENLLADTAEACQRRLDDERHQERLALMRGRVYATAYRVCRNGKRPLVGPERIPADYWRFLEMDGATGASCTAVEYIGLRFHAVDSRPKTIGAEQGCRKWLVKVMKRPREKTIQQLSDQASDKFPGLSENGFKRAVKFAKRAETTHPTWKCSGPVRRFGAEVRRTT